MIIPSRLTQDERINALRTLNERLAGSEVGVKEEKAAVDEALRSIRPGYRPIG